MASSGGNKNFLVVPDSLLMWLGHELTAEWQNLGRILGISQGQLYSITENNKGNVGEAKHQMLIYWKQKEGLGANHESLTEALIKVKRKDLADQLQQGVDSVGRIVQDIGDSFSRNVYVPSALAAPDIQGKKEQFLEDINEKYGIMYNQVQPVTYIRDRCVNDVFIDSGMEYLNREGISRAGRGTWHKLDSYNSMFTDPRLANAMVYVLIGEPGYGKSTIALKYAYDWCNRCPDSPLKDVELLILLQLRHWKKGFSIFNAIRQSLLTSESKLSEDDIANILESCKSVVLVFDGFDEYTCQDDRSKDDVVKITEREMFRKYKVVLTTRPSTTPPKLVHKAEQVRLTGFDDQARERYILKAVVDGNSQAAAKILRQLQQSPVFADICQVALFFVIFAHLTHEMDMPVVVESVTSFFRFIVSSFYEHNQIRAGAVSRPTTVESAYPTEHEKLCKFAFESRKGQNRDLIWRKETFMELICEPMYKKLVDIGVLVEENVVAIVDHPGISAADLIQRRIYVSFYHKLFCEWYAAHYVADFVSNSEDSNLTEFFEGIDPFELQYVYRIACGLNPAAASKIIQYLHNVEGGNEFAILCILEQTGDMDILKEIIREICLEGVVISAHDSLLLQRSTMQLLEIAAGYEIPISKVILDDCLQSVDFSIPAIRTTSGLALTSRFPVKKLLVVLINRDVTEDEAIATMQFAVMCPSLRILGYFHCVPPRAFTNKPTLSSLKSRDIEVCWRWPGGEPKFILNLQTGRWENENDGSEPTEEDFTSKMESIRRIRSKPLCHLVTTGESFISARRIIIGGKIRRQVESAENL